MQKSPIVRLRAPLPRRFVALLTTAAYLLVCTGLPMPLVVASVEAVGKAGAQPFPCQGHRCGCRTAEQCWKSCCCMSDLEKRMWAERNRVPLPDYLISQSSVVAEVSVPSDRTTAPVRSCCKKSSGRSPAKPSTCGDCPTEAVAKSSGKAVCSSPATAAAATEEDVQWVSYLASQRCSGGATDVWTGGPTSLPAASCLVAVSRVEVVRPLVRATDDAAEATFSFPPRRPPRIA